MYPPSWWIALFSQCIASVGSLLFFRYRHCFPISKRQPWFTLTGVVPLTIFNVNQMVDYDRRPSAPCSAWSAAVLSMMIPISILGFYLRSWILLFYFEIMADISRANTGARSTYSYAASSQPGQPPALFERTWTVAALGGAGPASAASAAVASPTGKVAGATTHSGPPELSWYSRNTHMMKWKWLWSRTFLPTIAVGLLVFGVTVNAGAGRPCDKTRSQWTNLPLWWCSIYCLALSLFILRTICKLARHGQDSLGWKHELLFIMIIGVGMFISALVYVIGGVQLLSQLWRCTVLVGVFAIWAALMVYPGMLALRHWRRQKALVDTVQRLDFEELLKLQVFQAAFMTFLSKEFCAESLRFYIECVELENRARSAEQNAKKKTSSAQAYRFSATHALKDARAIYRVYIVDGSQFEVNLSANMRRSILNSLTVLENDADAAVHDLQQLRQLQRVSAKTMTGSDATMMPRSKLYSSHVSREDNLGAHAPPADAPADGDALYFHAVLGIYRLALGEVVRLMKDNSFARFRQSKEYDAMVATIRGVEVAVDNETLVAKLRDASSAHSASGDCKTLQPNLSSNFAPPPPPPPPPRNPLVKTYTAVDVLPPVSTPTEVLSLVLLPADVARSGGSSSTWMRIPSSNDPRTPDPRMPDPPDDLATTQSFGGHARNHVQAFAAGPSLKGRKS